MTAGSRISIINIAELQNEHFAKEEDSMSTVKMGLTIEEAEPFGIHGLPFHRFHMEKK